MAEIATGTVESTVSDWAAPVVGGLVSAAVDTAGRDYDVYTGNKIADTSDLQSSAFTGISGLATPQAVTNATTERLRNLRMQVPRLVISSPPPAHIPPQLPPISLAVYLIFKQVNSRQGSMRPKPTQVVPSMQVLYPLV